MRSTGEDEEEEEGEDVEKTPCWPPTPPMTVRQRAIITQLRAGSTRSLLATKKSWPRMGLETAACRKGKLKLWPPNFTAVGTVDQEAIGLPPAPTNGDPEDGLLEK